MKKRLVFLLSLIIILYTPAISFARENPQTVRNVILSSGETVNHDYLRAGDNVTVSGTVNGDIYVAGGNLTVDGIINGDVLAVGGTININGKVSGNIRAIGGRITLSNASIGRNVSVIGGNLNFNNDTRIAGSLSAAGGNLNLFSEVAKEANLAGGDIILGSIINGPVNIGAGQIGIKKTARIKGDLNYWSGDKAQIENGAIVSGKIQMHELPRNNPDTEKAARVFAQISLFVKVLGFITYLTLGLLLISFYPKLTQSAVSALNEKPSRSFLIGFLSFFLIPAVFIILLVTVIGIPLAFILMSGYFLLSVFGIIITSLWFGQKVLKSENENSRLATSLLVGLVIYEIPVFLPFIGWLIKLIAVSLGIGALVWGKKNYYRLMKEKDLV